MAGTTVTPQTTIRKGALETPAQVSANAEGLVMTNDGRTLLEVEASGAETKLTFSPLVLSDGKAAATYEVVIAIGKTKMIGPFPRAIYNNASENLVITTSNTNAKCRAFSMGS